jgi:WD40 repeat protein
MTCSADGRLVALSSRTLPASTVLVLDVDSGDELRRLDRCFSPAFSPDGRVLAGSDGRSLRRWDLKSGAELPGLEECPTELRWVAFHPDGASVTATYKGCFGSATWDLATRKMTSRSEPAQDRPEATALTFAPGGRPHLAGFWGESWLGGPPFLYVNGGRWILSGWRRKLIEIRDLSSAAEPPLYSLHLPFASPEYVDVSEGGDVLMRIAGTGVQVEQLPTAAGRPNAEGKKKHVVTAVGFTARGEALIADSGGTLLRWDAARQREIRRSALPPGELRRISADGSRGLLENGSGDFRVWDLEEDRDVLNVEGIKGISASSLSPDGGRVAIGTVAGDIAIWDVVGRKELARIRGAVGVTAIAWSRDARTLAWGDTAGSVSFADGDSGREPLRLQPRGGPVTALVFLGDGKTLASGDRRGNVYLWKDELGKGPELFVEEKHAVGALAPSPDGRWLAVASGGQLHLRPLGAGVTTVPFSGYPGAVHSLAFSPDGTRVAAGGEDATAILWGVPPGK